MNALKSSRIIVPFSSKFIEPEYVKRVENNTKKTQKIFDKANVKSGWLKSEEAQQELGKTSAKKVKLLSGIA